MTTETHSPAPLKVLKVDDPFCPCFTVHEDRPGRATLVAICEGQRAEANAHLFKAAPGMLDACKGIDNYARRGLIAGSDRCLAEIATIARDAIADAEPPQDTTP